MKKGDAIDAAVVFGKGKAGALKPPMSEMAEEEYEIPADFEDEAIRFMPELEGDSARMMAFWKAVKACMGA